jgi:hypothetical protein
MAYDTQLDWINKMFTAAGVTSLRKTHAGRSQRAKYTELKGVDEGQTRRTGRWNSDALTNCYLTYLPRKFMRSMTGFSPSIQGNFYLLRAKTLPQPLSPSASPAYVLSRTISTVPQLWREWTVGLGNGPSVQGLEDLYGPRWRPAHSEK